MTNITGGSAVSAPPPPAPAEPGAVAAAPSPVKIGASELKARVLSALALAPPVLWAMWQGGAALTALLAVACAVGAGEWAAMVASRRRALSTALAAAGAGGAFLLAVASSPWWALLSVPLAAGLALLQPADRRALGAIGAPYVLIGCLALWALAAGPGGGAALAFVVLAVWATDIGAYAAGRKIGGPKLAPRISPKKTWAGLIGGMSAAAAVAALIAATLAAPVGTAALAGAGLAVVAQAGDLYESWIKRRVGVKDSSRLIPGHGGLLDRIDGLLTAAPALAAYQGLFGAIFA